MRIYSLIIACLFSAYTNAFANPVVKGKQGMVVSEQHLASEVGLNILKAGGNAVDAAVAVGYALAVVDPCCGNIGGGGFMLIHMADGKNIFINFREQAGSLVHKDSYLNSNPKNQSTQGYSSVAIPGTVLGFETALKKYGTLKPAQVIQPAIELAEKGFVITPYEAKRYAQYEKLFKEQKNVSEIFLKDNHALTAGTLLKQPQLASTLALIAHEGSDVFYKGSIAKTIVKASEANGGYLRLKDFENYHVEMTKPLKCHYRGYTILTSPPPGSGVTLCEMLGILENFPLSKTGANSSESIKNIIEAMRFGFNDRNTKLGDPAFVKNETDKLISHNYTLQISKKIKGEVTAPHPRHSSEIKELTDTTHYSVVDKNGNAVSVTYTLNGFFGAGVIAGDTGFFLNNQMDDFATHVGASNKFGLVQADANAVAAGKRPLSSMMPTIVLKNKQLYLVLGSPGGPRIISAVLLTLLNMIDLNLSLQAAIDSPRFHFQGQPDVVSLEVNALSPKIRKNLRRKGYKILAEGTWAAIAAVLVDDRGLLTGVIDRRRPDGAAVGY